MIIFKPRYDVRTINLNGCVFTNITDRWRGTSSRLVGWWRADDAVRVLKGLRACSE